MPRKKKVIVDVNGWTYNEIKCAKLFTVGWTVPEKIAVEHSGVTNNTLKRWEQKGYIEKKANDKTWFYKPTDYGVLHIEKATGNHCHKTNESSWRHNYELLNRYCSIEEKEQDSWLTEADLKKIAMENDWDFKEVSCTDGAYIDSNTGEWQCIEIVTKHYKQEHIEKKIEFVSRFGGVYESYKI